MKRPKWIGRVLILALGLILAFLVALREIRFFWIGVDVGDAHRFFWRTLRTIAGNAFWPGCGFYRWRRFTGGLGPSRWLWRAPNHPAWVFASEWIYGPKACSGRSLGAPISVRRAR